MQFLKLPVTALIFFCFTIAGRENDSGSLERQNGFITRSPDSGITSDYTQDKPNRNEDSSKLGIERFQSKVTVSGVVDFSMGEIMSGMYRAIINPGGPDSNQYPRTVSHAWFGNPLARLNIEFTPSDNVKAIVGFEGNIFINTFPTNFNAIRGSNGNASLLPQFMGWGLHQAQGIFSLLDNETMSLSLSLGLMPYKYNPEIRNLGEFLFRTGTYPFFIVNDFDFPLARLSGARLNFRRGGGDLNLSVDQFVLIERTSPPMNDISLATIASVNAFKLFDLGAGVDFARIIPVNGDNTTPRAAKYLKGPGDTAAYTFKGIKIMARATLDPFGRLRGDGSFVAKIMGDNGGKLYGETAIVGLKNYPASSVIFRRKASDSDAVNPWGYTKISERMPWVVGINIPLWKLLDVCAVEFEKYPAPYPNDYYQVYMNQTLPIPTWQNDVRHANTGYDSAVYRMDRWFWSVYMKKQIMSHFSLLGQVSRDHLRWDVNAGNEGDYDTEEIMVKQGQWSWRFGLLFEF